MSQSWLDDYLREHLASGILGDLTVETSYSTPMPRISVQKYQMFVPVSTDLAMDMGIIPDTRPPRKPPTRRERFRWWRSGLRDRFATWAYERISGDKFPDPYDD